MAEWRCGSFQFPTSTGSFEVELDIAVEGVLFFGSNQGTEDTLLSGGNPGVFFGMAWKTLAGATDYQSQANTTFGVRWQAKPITMNSSGGTVQYEASSLTFGDGFTINVTTAAPGTRYVHYIAWGDEIQAHGSLMASPGSGTAFDFATGYRVFSMLMFSMFASGRADTNGSSNYLTLGVANFPDLPTVAEVNALNNNANGFTFRTQTQLGQVGLTEQWYNGPYDDSITASVSSGLVGTFQDQFDHARPYPTYIDPALRVDLYGYTNQSSIAWMDVQGSAHQIAVPALGVTAAYEPRDYMEGIAACLFFGTTGWHSAAQGDPHVAFTLGMLGEDANGDPVQACCGFDSGAGDAPANDTPYFFQSRQACYVDSLHSGGVRVASGEIVGNEIELTGEIASSTALDGGFVQMWEGPSGVTVMQRRRHVGTLP